MGDGVTALETLAACEAEGVAVTLSSEGKLSYHPVPSALVLGALRRHRDEILRTLRPAVDADRPNCSVVAAYDPTRAAVRIEYEEHGEAVGFWVVPDNFPDPTHDGEPAMRRSDLEALLDVGNGALQRALVVLRAFSGARVRAVGGSPRPAL